MASIKIALCQFAIAPTPSFAAMEARLQAQCERALAHAPDLVVFPEYVTFCLLAMAGLTLHENERHRAILNYVASFTPRYERLFARLASESGAIIAGGSHWTPTGDPGRGFNTAYLFFPDGRIERQPKNHLYPDEATFGTERFDGLSVFATPKARLGLMTCYEAEFPEAARHLALGGAQLLLCPTTTNTERGYHRVRYCCAARAVENQIYVAACHSVGGLPVPVERPFTAYGRSAIFGPIDDQTGLANGIVCEAERPDTETILVGEIDLAALKRSRECSEATILKDRRPDLYRAHYGLY